MRYLALFSTLLLFGHAGAQTVAKSDREWTSEGSYTAYASPWCAFQDTSLVPGRDYVNTVSYRSGDLAHAKNIRFSWRWPEPARRKCGVYGFNSVAWGNYDGGGVRAPVAPMQVSAIAEFTVAYDMAFAADSDTFNGLGEFYLTKVSGAADQKAIEIGCFWNAPPATVSWAAAGKQIGAFRDRYGRNWTVAASEPGGGFVTFIPAGNKLTKGTFDAKGPIEFLRRAGLVEDGWWFNGIALGVEPLGGSGTAVVRKFQITLK